MTLLADLYDRRLQSGVLAADSGQRAILDRLDALSTQLALSQRRLLRRRPPRGLYIHGGVGRGKSMLMDLFFEAAPVMAKRRVHFDAFMLDVHARLHAARQGSGDPLPPVVADLATEARLLCFDEFQVNDIADAMILSRLFIGLLDRDVVVVATSNVAPDDLYRNGLQRARFLPFIQILKDRLDVFAVADGVDHRLLRLAARTMWIAPDDAEAAQAMDCLFAGLGGASALPDRIEVAGRRLNVPLSTRSACRFGFDALCGAALGAADYLALCARFSVIMVDHVPVLAPERRNETLRFIALVDQAYEARRLVVVAAAAPIDLLCPPDNAYAVQYRRTASRLHEMQSEGYISQSIPR